jgi:hypothetical protein
LFLLIVSLHGGFFSKKYVSCNNRAHI